MDECERDPVLVKVEQLESVFRRRLQEDRAKEKLIQSVISDVEERTRLDTGRAFADLMQEALLAIDRLRSEEPSTELSRSVAEELLTVFGRRGLAPIAVDGPVDGRLHQVVGTAEGGDDDSGRTIVKVEREGYTLGERVLRPARVRVAATITSEEPNVNTDGADRVVPE